MNLLRCPVCQAAMSAKYPCKKCAAVAPRGTCSIEGCEEVVKVKLRGWCSKHYQRWQKTGDPLKVHHEYRTDNVGYAAVHTRLRDRRGLAAEHSCACGLRAQDWAYLGNCPDEKTGRSGKYLMKYCVHIEDHYEPMCRKCHKLRDLALHLTPVYDPAQPRVPKGSGRRSGEFMKGSP